MGQHRGSGRGPHTIEHASHLDAADAARALGWEVHNVTEGEAP